ncbi:TRAP transporter small permease [Saccharospirillum mangrovi]|uniref:TRAP transporter small permease n=1 Tax=Saccharospirillum mangrovi TaxID=2161747 RepID=UPI000D34C1A4|nr:TRAP transporter small permease [Saccharospirillum mangrovi]
MFQRVLNGLYGFGLVLSAASLVSIGLLILAQIVGRWFGVIVPSAEDFTGFLLVSVLFNGLAYSFRHNAHIRVVLLLERLGPRRRLVELFGLTLLLGLTGYLTVAFTRFVLETYAFGDLSTGMVAVPLWIPQSAMVFGMALFCLAVLDDWLRCLRGQTLSYVLAEAHGEGAE